MWARRSNTSRTAWAIASSNRLPDAVPFGIQFHDLDTTAGVGTAQQIFQEMLTVRCSRIDEDQLVADSFVIAGRLFGVGELGEAIGDGGLGG